MNIPYRRIKWLLLVLLALIMLLAVALPRLRAEGGLVLRWAIVSSGYSLSRSEHYTFAATGGEIDAIPPQAAGSLILTGGFWSGVDEAPPAPQPITNQFRIFLPSAIGGK